jgi:hypothetical protein
VKWVHITGCRRSGTTLLREALVSSFRIDGHAPEEHSILVGLTLPDDAHEIFCSKKPAESHLAPRLLAREPDLHFVWMLRDPRDVVVSRHARAPDRYWTPLRMCYESLAWARRIWDHPRFTVVRYEDLVRDPDATQRLLQDRMPFLEATRPMREYDRMAEPTRRAAEALGALRAIDTESIGNWRNHKPRLAAQIKRHGDPSRILVELGYEKDDSWRDELRGVEPCNGETYHAERTGALKRIWQRLRLSRQIRRYRRRQRAARTAQA